MTWMFLGIALFLGVAGYLIRYKKRIDLIAGYRRGKFKDEAALARWFGNRLLAAAGIAMVFIPFIAIFKGFALYFLMGYVTILILGGMFSNFSEDDFSGQGD